MFSKLWGMLVGVLCAGVLGCGGATVGKVKGQITYNKEPVPAAVLHVHLKDQGIASMTKIVNGAFKFSDELPVGKYAAYVTPPTPEPADPTKPKAAALPKVKLPKKSLDHSSSGLIVEVKPGTNDVKLELID